MALCFEIAVNRGVPIVAGLEDIGVLTACVTYVSSHNEVEVRVGGLVSRSRHDNEHIDWLEQDLKLGDEVLIRVVESVQPSPPTSRRHEDPDVAKNQERQYYLDLKKRHESE